MHWAAQKCQIVATSVPGTAGARRKGMYGPLTLLLPRLGAQRMLALQPDLVGDAVAAMENQAVCGAASSLVMAVLRRLRSELNAGTQTQTRCGNGWESRGKSGVPVRRVVLRC